MWPSTRAAGSTLIEHRRDDDPVALAARAARRRGAPASLPVTSSVTVPPRSGEMCSSPKSSMLIRAAPKALGDLGEHAGPVGDVDAAPGAARPASANDCSSMRRRLRAASPMNSGQELVVAPLERRLDLVDPAAELGELDARPRRRCRGASRVHIRGLAPAIRVMSRSEPPALASGSCPAIAAARRPG